jgi:hypothetical protein
MTARTKRNHQVEERFSGDPMMDNDRALPPTGSPTNSAAVSVALQNLLSHPAEIFIVLTLHGVAACTEP